MPVTSNDLFWSKLFDSLKSDIDRVYAEEYSKIYPDAAKGDSGVFVALLPEKRNYVTFLEYLRDITDEIDEKMVISGGKGRSARAKLHFLVSAARKSISSLDLDDMNQYDYQPEEGNAFSKSNILAPWATALANDGVETSRRALKNIVAKSNPDNKNTSNQSDEHDVLTKGHIENRLAAKKQIEKVFATEREKAIAQDYLSIVSGTWNFDCSLESLKSILALFENASREKAVLEEIVEQLEAAQANQRSVKFLTELYQSKKAIIETNLAKLYKLADGEDFADKVKKKYAGSFIFFTSSKKRRQALEQYVAANEDMSIGAAQVAKTNFNKILMQSAARVEDKSKLQTTLEALDSGSTSEATKIAIRCADAYREDIKSSLGDCYLGNAEDTNYQSLDILAEVKKACGWGFLSSWFSSEYRTAKQLLKAIDEVPVDKERIKLLSAELSTIIKRDTKRKNAPSAEVLATLDACAQSTWGESLVTAINQQESEVKKNNTSILKVVETYTQGEDGYPAGIDDTVSGCDYFVSEIFVSLTGLGKVSFSAEHSRLRSSDSATENLLDALRSTYVITKQNQYSTLLLLSLELVRIHDVEGKVYKAALLDLLLILLGKKDGTYKDALRALKQLNAPGLLINSLPESLKINITQNEQTKVYEAIDAIVAFKPVVQTSPINHMAAASPTHTEILSYNNDVSPSKTKGSHCKKTAAEISSMDEKAFLEYGDKCAKEVVATSIGWGRARGYRELIKFSLEKNLAAYPNCSKDILLVYTLWCWYAEKTTNGTELLAQLKDQVAPTSQFLAALKLAIDTNANLEGEQMFALPEKGGQGYASSGDSLQKLINLTKFILPMNCDPKYFPETVRKSSSNGDSAHDQGTVAEELYGYGVSPLRRDSSGASSAETNALLPAAMTGRESAVTQEGYAHVQGKPVTHSSLSLFRKPAGRSASPVATLVYN